MPDIWRGRTPAIEREIRRDKKFENLHKMRPFIYAIGGNRRDTRLMNTLA